MHWKRAFPSRYLQVSDLDDGPIIATIKAAVPESVGVGDEAESKLVVRFQEPAVKALVCNQTRAEAIAQVAGAEDIDQWPGTRIAMSKGTTSFKGKRVECIAVGAAPKTKKSKAREVDPSDDEGAF